MVVLLFHVFIPPQPKSYLGRWNRHSRLPAASYQRTIARYDIEES